MIMGLKIIVISVYPAVTGEKQKNEISFFHVCWVSQPIQPSMIASRVACSFRMVLLYTLLKSKLTFSCALKINLEIYAERQTDPQLRQKFLDLARGRGGSAHERESAVSRGR